MDSTQTVSLGLLIALIGAFVTLYNYQNQKSIKATTQGRWEGKVDQKLDTIISSFDTISKELNIIKEDLNKLHTRVTVLEKKRTTTKSTAE